MKSHHLQQYDGPKGIIPSEISQTKKQIWCDLIYMWNLKNKTNKENKMKTDL